MVYSVRVIQVAGKILVYGLGTFIGVCVESGLLSSSFSRENVKAD